ncbi:MAG: alpha/beta fold hydrolase [Bryobacteraceae bacterium]|nr:alpha/beta fold hydrolase [Bryobacteraceae bacterium]MDW8377429.1 YqiA/YcfP family alpha/beta fold hydrolase [Bryobacterales bacterium]
MTPTAWIYLHGFASGPSSKKARFFREKFESLGEKLEIPDLAGGDFEHLTLSGQLGVIQRVVSGRQASFIGSSLGGYLAALYASRHPEEVTRLVLLAPGFGFPQRWPESLGAEKVAAWRRTGKLWVYHYGEKRDMLLDWGLIEDAQNYESYPEVQQPCLIFHGKHDAVVPLQVSETFARGKPNVELQIVDSDHELLNVVEDIWARVSEFLPSARSAER